MVMVAEQHLESSYWAAVVAEGDADGGYFTDNDSVIPANCDLQNNFAKGF